MLLPVLGLLAATLRQDEPPPAPREFRGVWVATVDRIDWPPVNVDDPEKQKAALIAILDRAAALHFNAVLFQVRPMSDALYRSPYEPWSEFLTGTQGQAPHPAWDPLEFAVEEAHNRGLQLHAWFNPYRAWHPAAKGKPAANSVVMEHPDWVRSYGNMKWLDPGEPGVQAWSEKVILDVVKRYDVDGVHIDDYFYPYPIHDANKKDVPFPDDLSWNRYVAGGGHLSRDDWRRENINDFVSTTYREIKKEKPWVEFGISPFGIYRPGFPNTIKAGIDQYNELYSDPVKWLQNGWCDYITPQLYWQIKKPAQSYPVLAAWWSAQNTKKRHLWIGNNASQVSSNWPASEVIDQIEVTRKTPGAGGNIFFSMKPFMKDSKGIDEALVSGPYAVPALVPRSPWLRAKGPSAPYAKVEHGAKGFILHVARGSRDTVGYSLYEKFSGTWQFMGNVPENPAVYLISPDASGVAPEKVAVGALDHYSNESGRVVLGVGK
jgi:uncharacterized lipoprotein YddW (UPF0748 family)